MVFGVLQRAWWGDPHGVLAGPLALHSGHWRALKKTGALLPAKGLGAARVNTRALTAQRRAAGVGGGGRKRVNQREESLPADKPGMVPTAQREVLPQPLTDSPAEHMPKTIQSPGSSLPGSTTS